MAPPSPTTGPRAFDSRSPGVPVPPPGWVTGGGFWIFACTGPCAMVPTARAAAAELDIEDCSTSASQPFRSGWRRRPSHGSTGDDRPHVQRFGPPHFEQHGDDGQTRAWVAERGFAATNSYRRAERRTDRALFVSSKLQPPATRLAQPATRALNLSRGRSVLGAHGLEPRGPGERWTSQRMLPKARRRTYHRSPRSV